MACVKTYRSLAGGSASNLVPTLTAPILPVHPATGRALPPNHPDPSKSQNCSQCSIPLYRRWLFDAGFAPRTGNNTEANMTRQERLNQDPPWDPADYERNDARDSAILVAVTFVCVGLLLVGLYLVGCLEMAVS